MVQLKAMFPWPFWVDFSLSSLPSSFDIVVGIAWSITTMESVSSLGVDFYSLQELKGLFRHVFVFMICHLPLDFVFYFILSVDPYGDWRNLRSTLLWHWFKKKKKKLPASLSMYQLRGQCPVSKLSYFKVRFMHHSSFYSWWCAKIYILWSFNCK